MLTATGIADLPGTWHAACVKQLPFIFFGDCDLLVFALMSYSADFGSVYWIALCSN